MFQGGGQYRGDYNNNQLAGLMAQDRGPSWMAGQSESSNITHLPGLGPVPPPSQVGPGGGPPPRPAPVIYLSTARHRHCIAIAARMYIHVDDCVVLLGPPNQSDSTFLSSKCCSCVFCRNPK